MAYLSYPQLIAMGFKKLGRDVKISDKASIYNCESIEIGDYSRVDDFCVISGLVSIGRNVHITPCCLVAGGQEGIVLEDFSTLAYGVKIFSQSDDYSGRTMTNSTVPTKYKQEFKALTRVGRYAIIGAGAIVMPGVMIAEGCSVGAQSLVLRSTDPWGIYVGSPAIRIKERERDLLQLAHTYITESAT